MVLAARFWVGHAKQTPDVLRSNFALYGTQVSLKRMQPGVLYTAFLLLCISVAPELFRQPYALALSL